MEKQNSEKTQFSQKIKPELKKKFKEKAARLGGKTGEHTEGMIKTYLALPDDLIRRVNSPSTTIEETREIFRGFSNVDEIKEILLSKILDTRGKEKNFWERLHNMITETFWSP